MPNAFASACSFTNWPGQLARCPNEKGSHSIHRDFVPRGSSRSRSTPSGRNKASGEIPRGASETTSKSSNASVTMRRRSGRSIPYGVESTMRAEGSAALMTTRADRSSSIYSRVVIKAADPSARIVLSTPYGIDLPDLRRMVTDAFDDFDVVSLAPRGISPDALLRPLGVLRERLLPRGTKSLWIEWDPFSFGQRASWPGQLVKLQAEAKAFGIDYVFWVAEGTAITRIVLDTLGTQIGRRPFAGYLTRQRALLLIFGDTDAAAVVWTASSDAALTVEGTPVKAYTPTGDTRAVAADAEKSTLTVGNEPLLLAGIGNAVLLEAKQAGQAGTFPVLPAATDYRQAGDVSARLGRTNAELGLYNAPFREWRNDANEVVDVDGGEALRTNAARERVYAHFDVDDTFLYFVDGRSLVEITVEVRGASAPEQLGFDLWYDSMSGYRFTPWQWVQVSPGWVSYTVRIGDAAFANTWGWDFAINAAGNRTEELVIRSVTVRKVAP